MSRVISVITAVAWIPLLLGCIAAIEGDQMKSNDIATGTAMILIVCSVIAFSVWSAVRPKGFVAWTLLVVSLLPAYFFAPVTWHRLSWFGFRHPEYFFTTNWRVSFWFFEGFLLVLLPLLWAAVCWRLRRGVSNAP
jgi:hypothetical protein